MAHEINELAPGVHSFASAREHAWHRLGTVLDTTMTAEQALSAAHLAGWNVRKGTFPPVFDEATGTYVEVTDRFPTLYTNPVTGKAQYLGVVGGHYDPTQNEDTTDLLTALSGEGGAIFETAGSLRGGRETFVSMKVPSAMNVGGVDPIDLYLVALNSHDGTSAQRTMVTPVRVVCANTQAAALGSAKSMISVRHTKGSKASIVEARRVLGLTFKYAEAFEAEAERMLDAAITERAFQQIVAEVFGAGPAASTRAQNIAAKHTTAIVDLWRNDPFGTLGKVKGSRWAGYQAVTEYTDHVMSVRGADDAQARSFRAATADSIRKIKTDAFAQFSLASA